MPSKTWSTSKHFHWSKVTHDRTNRYRLKSKTSRKIRWTQMVVTPKHESPVRQFKHTHQPIDPSEWQIEFTLSNARRFYSSMGGVQGRLMCE